MQGHAAGATRELGLTGTVVPVGVAALGALLAGVGRVDVGQRNPGPPRLVGKEVAELGERPGVQAGPLVLAEPYPCADARQVLKGNSAPGALSGRDDSLGDAVVSVDGEPGLPSAPPLQEPLGALGSLGLQLASQRQLPPAVPVQAAPGHTVAVAGGGDVCDAQVDA